MEQLLYERPREKLRTRGVSSLTNTELLQLIIGSGTTRMPVAKMARAINNLLEKTEGIPDYVTLETIGGVGDATTCRILAALHLGARKVSANSNQYSLKLDKIRQLRVRSVVYAALDGAGQLIETYTDAVAPSAVSVILARRVCAKLLAGSAHGVAVALYSPGDSQNSYGMFELGFVADLHNIAAQLQLKVWSVTYVTKQSQHRLDGNVT